MAEIVGGEHERLGDAVLAAQAAYAETGLMPVVPDEAAMYGYEAENRHFTKAFLRGETPALTFDDGVEVMEILMTSYMSAEAERTLPFRPEGLDEFVPAVAKGVWRP